MVVVLDNLTEEFSHEEIVEQCVRVGCRDPKQRRQSNQIKHIIELANEQHTQEICNVK